MFKNPAMNSVMKKLTTAVKSANVSALSSTDNTEIVYQQYLNSLMKQWN